MVEALKRFPLIRLAFRPFNIKFDESSSTFLANVNSHQGLTICDKIDITKQPRWLAEGDFIWTTSVSESPPIPENLTEAFVGGFFELDGHFVDSKVKIKDIFCALIAPPTHFNIPRFGRREKPVSFITLRGGDPCFDEGPILLFWAEGLKKIE